MLQPTRHASTENYRYGFNGMENDNEQKDTGNSIDFGARMYDPRIGRWLSRDRYENLYAPISPYVFAINNPIKFLDNDGNIVVDDNGQPVTITVFQNENGDYSTKFEFVKNTSIEVQNSFKSNGGRAIKSAIRIETGRESIQKAIKSSENIHYEIVNEKHIYVDEEGITHYRLGETKFSPTLSIGDEKKKVYTTDSPTSIKDMKTFINVKLYQGSMDELNSLKSEEDIQSGLNTEERIGSTFVHENEHATNDEEVDNMKNDNYEANEKNHDKVREVEKKAVEEYKDLK